MSSPKRIFTASLVLGVSGSGKTSLLKTFAEYLWEAHDHKQLVLYSWDGGAIPTVIQQRMKQGLIRFWRVRTRSAPGLALETLYLATKGCMPARINPETGETDPAVRMVAPVVLRYTLRCPADQTLVKTVQAESLLTPALCPTCRTMVDRSTGVVHEEVTRTKGFEQIGGVAYDGLTSMCDVVMDHMDTERGKGLIGGEKSSFGGVVTSGTVKWGGNNRADVGFAQTRAQQFVNNSLTIPYLVEGPVFTALSTEGTDKGLTVVGADLPGSAALTQVPQWFGNICEADTRKDEQGKDHFVLRIRPFTDAAGRQHLLKTSASPTGPMPDVLEDPPLDAKQPFVGFNLGRMFKLLDEDLLQSLSEPLAGAAEVATVVADYGEPLLSPGSPAAGPATPPAAGSLDSRGGAGSAAPASVVAQRPPATRHAPPAVRPTLATPAAVGAGGPPPPGKPPERAPGS